MFRTKSVRTAAMLMLFAVFGYEMNLSGFVQMLGDGVSTCVEWVDSFSGKPIKIGGKKVV